VTHFLPEDFPKSWEYYFEIFFSSDRIKFADKEYVVFRFYVSIRNVTNLYTSTISIDWCDNMWHWR